MDIPCIGTKCQERLLSSLTANRDKLKHEQLGSGIPRILQYYKRDYFHFSDNFLRVILPSSEQLTPQVSQQVTQQVQELLSKMSVLHSRQELQVLLQLSDRKNFRTSYLQPAINESYIALTIPDKPTSSKQKYYLTEKGK